MFASTGRAIDEDLEDLELRTEKLLSGAGGSTACGVPCKLLLESSNNSVVAGVASANERDELQPI